ncbi:Rieske (2Fe-2S) protein [Sphingobacterium suaedae]|uniref:Rieske (2Fe-2S) protein n=1 Tax=Sphingobacterium suaedae TaxID=1686402 RepID=A0ABW5KKJ3_9SPHI
MDKHEWFLVPAPKAENQIEKRLIGRKKLCLVLIDGQLYASSSRCPHAGADLGQGWCEEKKLVCPFHRHRFDLQTGRGDPGQGDYIEVYPVKKEDGKWYVGIAKSWWKKIF